MSKRDKLTLRFFSKPRDFTFRELRTLLKQCGYEEIQGGATSGSRVAFFRPLDQHFIRLHKPHPSENLKRYQIDAIEDCLRAKGRLK